MNNPRENIIRQSRVSSDCYSCVLNQARATARLAGLTEEQTLRIVDIAKDWLEKSKTTPVLVQHIVRYVADAAIQELGESQYFDIYSDVKDHSNTLSLAYTDRFQKIVDDSESPLETGLQIASAGNIIDFGAKTHSSLNLDAELKSLNEVLFTRYDFEPFLNALGDASLLLYICDNSGEIVFDMIFIQELQRMYPNLRIVAALRDKPIINDATLADAKAVGLDRLVTTISSGSIYPGTIISETTTEFQDLFNSADLIISKGQGNFETLLPLGDNRIFFALRIKCEYMAALSKATKGDIVFIQGNSEHRA